MKTKKIKLNDVRILSFVTVSKSDTLNIKGGIKSFNFKCPQPESIINICEEEPIEG